VEHDSLRRVVSSLRLLIEQCEGGSLVFDQDTGATAFLNDKATSLLLLLNSQGEIAEADLCTALKKLWGDDVDFSVALASLEESRLVFQC